MIRINLMPHREMRRERQRKSFVNACVFACMTGVGIAFLVAMTIDQRIEAQNRRNEFIKAENAKLDIEIREIAMLRQEISALETRQRSVENLQSDRTTPVNMIADLVRVIPEGMYLKSFKQTDRFVVVSGLARANDNISEFLSNLDADQGRSLERPGLVEIKAIGVSRRAPKDPNRIFGFDMTMNVRTIERKAEAAADAGSAPTAAAAESPNSSSTPIASPQ